MGGASRQVSIAMFAAVAVLAAAPAAAQEPKPAHGSPLQEFVHGAPEAPSGAWTLAAGGRIYDTWWDALDRPKPRGNHPAYPATGQRSGPNTWRCVECHGWDYKGRDGINGKGQPLGERFTGIKGVRAARQMTPAAIVAMMRAAPHSYTADMIRDDELLRLAAFLRQGQHDTDRYIARATRAVRGDAKRGAALYQTICAACHGLDGRALNWGTREEPGFVGTEARALPWEVLHKIRNSHPGAAMVNLRALPLQASIDVLSYTQSLPEK